MQNDRRPEVQTVGVMFEITDGTLATLEVLDRTTNHVNLHGLTSPDGDLATSGILQWVAVAYDPRSLTYYDDDAEAMDETNFDSIIDTLGVAESELPTVALSYDSGATANLVGVEDALATGVAVVRGYSGAVLVMHPEYRIPGTGSQWHPSELNPEDDREQGTEVVFSLLRALADYPLLDESAYSEREWEAWQEYAPQAFDDEVRDATRNGIEQGAYAELLNATLSSFNATDSDRIQTFDSTEVEEMITEAFLQYCDDNAGELLSEADRQLDYQYGFSGDYGPSFLSIVASFPSVQRAVTDVVCEHFDITPNLVHPEQGTLR